MTTKTPYLSGTNLLSPRLVKSDSNCKVRLFSMENMISTRFFLRRFNSTNRPHQFLSLKKGNCIYHLCSLSIQLSFPPSLSFHVITVPGQRSTLSGPMELGLATPTICTGRKEVKQKQGWNFLAKDIFVAKMIVIEENW